MNSDEIRLMAPILYHIAKDLKIDFLGNLPPIPKNPNPQFFKYLVLVLSEDKISFDYLTDKIGIVIPLSYGLFDNCEPKNGDYFIWVHNGFFYKEVGWEHIIKSIKGLKTNERTLIFRELIYAFLYYGQPFLNTYAASTSWKKDYVPFLARRKEKNVVIFDRGIIPSFCGTATCIEAS